MSGFIEVVDMSDGSVHYLVRHMIQADQIIRVECDDDESKITVYTKLFDDPLVSYWDS